jgi:hypothetical protein
MDADQLWRQKREDPASGMDWRDALPKEPKKRRPAVVHCLKSR